jgi:hypothetical protein
MKISIQRRFAHGYELFTTYTWSHAIDDAPEQNIIDSATTVTLSDPSDRRRDRGNSLTDRRHVLNLTRILIPREQSYPERRQLRSCCESAAAICGPEYCSRAGGLRTERPLLPAVSGE